MALSCSTQILQRSWQVYFRQGTLCLASSAARVGFRSRVFTSSSFISKSHSCVSLGSLPVWRPHVATFGFQSVRALSSSSLESAQGSGQVSSSLLEEDHATKELKDLQEETKVTASASVAEGEDEDRLGKNVDSAPTAAEKQYNKVNAALQEDVEEAYGPENPLHQNDVVINAALQEDVEEALGTVDLLDDGGRPESVLVDGEAEDSEHEDQHPWPEWDKFLNMLEAGGHFVFDTEPTDRRPVVRQEDDSGKIKRASMAFARNRDDVIKYDSTRISVCIT